MKKVFGTSLATECTSGFEVSGKYDAAQQLWVGDNASIANSSSSSYSGSYSSGSSSSSSSSSQVNGQTVDSYTDSD